MDQDDIRDLLAIVQAVDSRDIGDVDVTMWLTLLSGLHKDDCLGAIMAHRREEPGVWLEPGHVVKRAKAIARDRLDRMNPDDRALVVGGADLPRDRYGHIDKTTEGASERALSAYRWETGDREEIQAERAEEALPRGTYIAADPAGWTYGNPTSRWSIDHDPDEAKHLRMELDARIREYRKRHPDASNAEAEQEIRIRDKARSVKFLENVKRGDLAGVFGDLGMDHGDRPEVIDAEVVDLDNALDPSPIPATVGSELHSPEGEGMF
jgi:hypothetical protein